MHFVIIFIHIPPPTPTPPVLMDAGPLKQPRQVGISYFKSMALETDVNPGFSLCDLGQVSQPL